MKEITIEFNNIVEVHDAIITLGNAIIELSHSKYAEINEHDIEILKKIRRQMRWQNN